MNAGASWLYLATLPTRAAKAHPWLEKAAMAGAIACVLAQLWLLQGAVKSSALARETPVHFPGNWTVVQPGPFKPGQWVRFRYERVSTESGVLVLLLDTFENLDTGESYEGSLMGKAIDKAGPQRLEAVRQLPWRMAPGHYRLVGWASPQTSKRSQPTGYLSDVFEVVK